MSADNPLLLAMMNVDSAARSLMRHTGSHRQKEELRDAVADLRRNVLDVVTGEAAEGATELDVATFKAIVRHAHMLGLAWPDMVEAFNDVRQETGS